MSVLKLTMTAVALTFVLAAGPAAGQTPPATQQPPAGQKPPAGTTPPPVGGQAPTAPAPTLTPKPQPPAPFPQGAKIAFINIQSIAAGSTVGKDASKKLQDLNSKKVAEINDKQKQLQALQTKLNQGTSVMNDSARGQLEKDIDKLQRDIQFSQQNAQAEMTELQNDLQGEFQQKLLPIVKAVAEEKGLHAVFSIGDSGVAYYDPGLDISDEVIKRLDTAKPAAPPVKN
jgi:outer membrane protein